jgi:hypothetical protein
VVGVSLEYLPGDWTGLAAGTGVVLLAPTVPPATVRAVWDALAAGRPITQWLEIIAGGGISSLPAFALVERTPDGVRVLLRGDVVVDVDGTEVAARGMSTWREVLVEAATDIVVRSPGPGGTSGTARTVGETWPLVGGVVRAARIRVDLADAAPVAAAVEAAAAGASAEAPTGLAEAPAPGPDAPAPGPEARPAPAVEPPPAVAVTTPAADVADGPAAEDPAHAEDDSAPMAAPVDVFAEAGFGPADDRADDAEDDLVDGPVIAEFEDGDAGDDLVDEPVVAEFEDGDAFAEPLETQFEDETASAQTPSPSDGDVDDLAHHETYVGPVPDIAPPGSVEPAQDEPAAEREEPGEPTASGAPESETASPVTPGTDVQADAVAADAYVADADVADADVADQGAGESPVPPRPPEGTPTAEYEQVGPVSSGLIDSLPWNMPNARAADARPAEPSPVPAFDPPAMHTSVPSAPSGAGDAEIEGDHDGETILVSHLRTAYAQDAADAVPNQPPSATIVPGVADDALYDEPRPVIMLAVSSGPRVPLDRVVLIGRAPESSRFAGALMPRLVTVPSPQQDISRTHVEVRLEGDHVVVTDLRSTNGTMVAVPGNDPRRLHPGEGVPVPVGSLIDLGDGITIGVESSGSPHGQGH